MAEPAKEEFIQLIYEINRLKGLDELSSKLLSMLYIEPKEISLDELAKRTGYSLSAVCTAMKLLEKTGVVRRSKKPKSKRVYFYMEKDVMSVLMDVLKKFVNNVSRVKQKVPGVIEKYKREKSKSSREELRIIENYYKQILACEEIMGKLAEMVENARKNDENSRSAEEGIA